MLKAIRSDIQAAFERDPAARSTLEILLCYPGLHALVLHRVAHWLWQRRLHLAARWLSHLARLLTGVEIHPAARIGGGVFIDHGMGVVIGETAEVGDNVTLFQGATLGGTGKEKGKRHPTVGDNVTIGAGAKVLGNITVGDNSMIGSGAVVLRSVPPNATAVGVPARVIVQDGRRAEPLAHDKLPDPLEERLRQLSSRIEELSARLEELEKERALSA